MLTRRAGAGTGSGRSSIWLNSEKMAAFAPMPSASDTIATMVTKGVLKRVRSANFRLGIMVEGVDVPEEQMVYEPRDPIGESHRTHDYRPDVARPRPQRRAR